MRPFTYQRATSLGDAARLGVTTGRGETDAPTQFLAGGTTVIDLMKLDVLRPQTLVDIAPLAAGHDQIEASAKGLRLGAWVKMSAAAGHPAVLGQYPVIAESLSQAASAQLRNMATLGGNVLQRTRCSYFRDPSWTACNKRTPGSGCAALTGVNRNHAVLGVTPSCIAQYPGDFAVALAALDAEVELSGPSGVRNIPFSSLHRSTADQPHIENTLQPGEVITAFFVPAGAWTKRSTYLKIRDRASYEFAIASAAVALELDGDIVRQVRVGIGGNAYSPWRAHDTEAALVGKPLTPANAEAAARLAFRHAISHGENAYKLELGPRTIVRALLQAKTMEV